MFTGFSTSLLNSIMVRGWDFKITEISKFSCDVLDLGSNRTVLFSALVKKRGETDRLCDSKAEALRRSNISYF